LIVLFECEPVSSLSKAEEEATRRAKNNAEETVIRSSMAIKAFADVQILLRFMTLWEP